MPPTDPTCSSLDVEGFLRMHADFSSQLTDKHFNQVVDKALKLVPHLPLPGSPGVCSQRALYNDTIMTLYSRTLVQIIWQAVRISRFYVFLAGCIFSRFFMLQSLAPIADIHDIVCSLGIQNSRSHLAKCMSMVVSPQG